MDNIKHNKNLILKFENTEYFKPSVTQYNQELQRLIAQNQDEKLSEKLILNNLKRILWNSQDGVTKIIDERILKGEIRDAAQARKSVAGNNFQRLVAYSLARNVVIGNITGKIFVATTSKDKILEKYATIHVGYDGDIQKPDSDILLYSDNEKEPLINFSCKTSLRERAGQTYKWKLLMDIANCKCEHSKNIKSCPVNLYNIKYENTRKVFMCFVTSDLYDEVNQPQTTGMFNFFDKAFITKSKEEFKNPSISTFSTVVDYLNSIYNK